YSFPATLGRDPSCHAAVRAPGVSRRHAEITRINGAYYLTDLGSSNGSAVNGAEVTGAARIEDGGSIELGVTPVSVEFI
ncbi:MAG: FHA domain-containing protein, partial [Oscillospiraceae bacterium]|nr:FHA domain-containing protein [Oscillospiraceae bacterium]